MLLKFAPHTFLLVFTALTLTLATSSARYPPFCAECEDEVWEEVPCDEIATSSTPTPTTTTSTTTTTAKPPPRTTVPPSTTPAPSPPTTTAAAHSYTKAPPIYGNSTSAPIVTTTSADPYQRCYCECKVGCKEFCRKVVINADSKKEIMQITKTSQQVPSGQLESKHIHEHKFVPSPVYAGAGGYTNAKPKPIKQYEAASEYPIESSVEADNSYELPKLAYKVQPPTALPPRPPVPAPPALLPPSISFPYPLTAFAPQQQSLPPPSPPPSLPTSPYLPPNIYEDSKGTNYYPDALVDASYSVDELTRLLQSESLNKIATYTYAPLSPAAPPQLSYYGPPPPSATNYAYGPQPAPSDADGQHYDNKPSQYESYALNAKAESQITSTSTGVDPANIDYANYLNKNGDDLPPKQYAASAPHESNNKDQLGASSLYNPSTYDNPMGKYLNAYSNAPSSSVAIPGNLPPYPPPYGLPY